MLKILRAISKISFVALAAIFIGAIFIVKLRTVLEKTFIFLFLSSIIFEVAYQLLSGITDWRAAQKKLHKYNKLPPGNYKIRDKDSHLELGVFTDDEIDYLRKLFLNNGMDDNEFYFDSMTFEFFKKEKPPAGLKEKIQAILKLKDPVEIVWNKERR